jgi:DNA-binding transcriptional LysR family regulator
MDRLQLLGTFARVVEAGSLSGAARQLGTSLSTVSRQLAALEAELGVTLVDRTTRAMHVTADGLRLHPHALAVLRAMDDARASVTRHDALAGSVRLSVPVALGLRKVVPVLAPLLARHERLQVELLLDNRRVTLASEGVDVVVRTGPSGISDAGDLVARSLGSYRFVICAAPALLAAHPASTHPRALAGLPVVGYRGIRSVPLRRGAETHELAVDARLSTNDAMAMLGAALAGLGFAVLPDWLVEQELARGELRAVLPDWTLPPGEAWVAYRPRGRGQRTVRALVDHLAASLGLRA